MNFFDSLKISASGMRAQRLRTEVISSNLANINTTRTAQGGAYKRKEVIFAAIPLGGDFHELLVSASTNYLREVGVAGIVTDPRPPILKYDPNHPDADDKGYVAFPNINLVEEMVDLISSTRSYEANVAAFNAAKDMALKTLEIGK